MGTKGVTSAAVTGAGDLVCQSALEKREVVDWRRFASFTSLGGLLVAPTLHFWYGSLFRWLPEQNKSSVARRLCLDQGLFAPLFLPTFMAADLTLESHPNPRDKIRRDWWPALTTSWQIWVPAQAINFGFVPLHFQVLFANGVALIWNTYLSWIAHR